MWPSVSGVIALRRVELAAIHADASDRASHRRAGRIDAAIVVDIQQSRAE